MPKSREKLDPFSGLEEVVFPRYRAARFDLARALRDGKKLDAIEAFEPWRAFKQRLPRLALPGSVPHEEAPPPGETEEPATELAWIQIRLLDEAGTPMSGAAYKIALPGGGERSGTLDDRGEAREEGIERGSCKVSFPDLAERPLPPAPT